MSSLTIVNGLSQDSPGIYLDSPWLVIPQLKEPNKRDVKTGINFFAILIYSLKLPKIYILNYAIK